MPMAPEAAVGNILRERRIARSPKQAQDPWALALITYPEVARASMKMAMFVRYGAMTRA
jgi:hypothetical protein